MQRAADAFLTRFSHVEVLCYGSKHHVVRVGTRKGG